MGKDRKINNYLITFLHIFFSNDGTVRTDSVLNTKEQNQVDNIPKQATQRVYSISH
jgi:hypothetical protein